MTHTRFVAAFVMPVVLETMDFDRTAPLALGMSLYYGEHGFTSVCTEEQDPMGVVLRVPDDNYPYLCIQCWTEEAESDDSEKSWIEDVYSEYDV